MKSILILITTLALAPLAALYAADADATPAPSPAVQFRNPDLPVAQRVDDLIGRLSVAEKISQLMMASPAIPRLGIAVGPASDKPALKATLTVHAQITHNN